MAETDYDGHVEVAAAETVGAPRQKSYRVEHDKGSDVVVSVYDDETGERVREEDYRLRVDPDAVHVTLRSELGARRLRVVIVG